MNEDIDSKELLEMNSVMTEVVKRLVVSSPATVKVTNIVIGPSITLSIYADKADRGRILGSQGKRIRALATMTAAWANALGREGGVILDEKTIPAASLTPTRTSTFGIDAKSFDGTKELLKRIVTLLCVDKDEVEIVQQDAGMTSFFEIRVTPEDYPAVFGPREIPSDFGVDGNVMDALKNIFDGIGKNSGHIAKLVLNQK